MHGCANCGTPAPDNYCPACGQNTRERLPTFRQFMREATGRYIAYDGKFWKTLAALLFRPGFLTREYLAGRRRRYIGPARLFLVSSLLLFATLKFATDSINVDEAMQFDPPKEPRTKVEPDATSEKDEKLEKPDKRERDDAKDKGDFVTLDDDFNLNLSELAGSVGNPAKADRPLQQPAPRAEDRADHGRRAALRPLRDVRAAPGDRGAAQDPLPRAQPPLSRAPASVWRAPRVRRAQPRVPLRHRLAPRTCLPRSLLTGALGLWMLVYLAWSTRAVYGGRWIGIVARAMVLGLAYLILFGFVT